MPLADEIVPTLSVRSGAFAGKGWLAAGMLLWFAVAVLFWPAIALFGDDVGYLGQARLLLADISGQAPATWNLATRRRKYPLFPFLLLSPLLRGMAAGVFALGIGAALVTCWLTARCSNHGERSGFGAAAPVASDRRHHLAHRHRGRSAVCSHARDMVVVPE